MYVEEIILKLSDFWQSHGSSGMQAIDIEIGAATLHPITALNTISKDKFMYHYVQPCRRPDDNRNMGAGDRASVHHQFQVIVKPYLNCSQEVYVKSLNCLGIKYGTHILDFIGDNWQNPSIGAWGIGSEAHCNGIEISQLTYFKQIGGININITPFEIAYGLERIAMILQKVPSIIDVQWSRNITVGDMLSLSEKDDAILYSSRDYRDSITLLMTSYMKIARRLLESGGYYTSYTSCLKAIGCFNILDAQRCLSKQGRQSRMLEIRDIVFDIFKKYNEQHTNRVTF